ncbi:MAG TPA: alpha-hydroxy acid oxidase [Steroidobacteraceae bacterium]|nr:alpha-hydroxy acid oxidase [Steroidobacteraceae bacterium]
MPWRRRRYGGSDLSRALCVEDLRQIARRRVPGFVFEYVEGGAEDEATLRRNRTVFERLRLVPNTLVNTTARHQRTALFGRESASPLIIAPTGGNGVLYPRGDVALARAAARAGIPFCLSTVSTVRLEQLAREVGGRLWMQLYVMRERKVAEDIVQRADAAGYEALVLTSDANVFGQREWDRRNYRRPGRPTGRALLSLLGHPRWCYEILLRHGAPQFENVAAFLPPGGARAVGGSTKLPLLFTPDLTWEDVAWLRRIWPRKLLVKGLLSAADAERAAAAGCDGIVLSNHGGRQLDACVSGVEMLPEIVNAVGKRLTIIVDGGFRRGTDVVKALALGAHHVMLGRATLYGLTAGGERGVDRVLEILTAEIDRALGQLGCCGIAELGPQFLRGSMHNDD